MSLDTCQIGAMDRYARDRHPYRERLNAARGQYRPAVAGIFPSPLGSTRWEFVGFHQFRDLSLEPFGLGFQPGNLGGDRFGQIGSDFV
jgi:hypothetical protein